MYLTSILASFLTATAAVSAFPSGEDSAKAHPKRPSLFVPGCPRKTTARFDKSVPEKDPFPVTHVDLCWQTASLHLNFIAYNETSFYFDPKHGINDDIWKYEVMEAFISHGSEDPQTYLEFEVNPNNVSYHAIVFNPSKVRAEGAAFDHFFINNPHADGFSVATKLDRNAQTWRSDVRIPLGLFNVERAQNTRWRMNFFRTVTSPEMFPNQKLGGWNSPNKPSFHITPFFGDVILV
ncbi:hypothetical protein PRK78_003075 [Emydomyces testavorans]|uniref:Carbohydrate-binding domain-containing protein n=1 Tax=Emydomyces testavorans TaxID=2070801 RepID=A0AAF0DG43_9EURO|nr:hypothetical protein PRK78_003075 [Emydomyces testavorans]